MDNYEVLKKILEDNVADNLEMLHKIGIINVRRIFISQQEVEMDKLRWALGSIFDNYGYECDLEFYYNKILKERIYSTFIWDNKILVFDMYLSKPLKTLCSSLNNLNIVTYYLDLDIDDYIHSKKITELIKYRFWYKLKFGFKKLQRSKYCCNLC